MDISRQQQGNDPASSGVALVEATQQQNQQSTSGPASNDRAGPAGMGESAQIGSPPTADITFDISSYDPLQAHAYQLTESAGLGGAPAAMTTTTAPTPAAPTTATVAHDFATMEQPHVTQQAVAPGAIRQTQQVAAPAPPPVAAIPAPSPAAPTQQLVYTLAGAPGTTYVATAPPAAPGAQPTQFFLADASGTPILSQTIQLAPGQNLDQIQAGPAGAPTVLIRSAPTTIAATTNKRSLAAIAGGTVGTTEPAPKQQQLIPTAASASPLMTIPLLSAAPAPLAPQVPGTSRGPITPSAPTSDSDIPPLNRPQPDLSKMTADERRRHERNLREQQRSFKISQQIKELKTVLTESNIPFKPNKFSILLSVSEYIKQLQSRAIMLDAEHKKLVATIRQTNDMVNSGQMPAAEEAVDGSNLNNQSDLLFVQGLDYKAVFEQASAALSVAALDGRILECNQEFQDLSGLQKEELLRQSLFTLLKNHEAVFQAMGEMLDSGDEIPDTFTKDEPPPQKPAKYYSGIVVQKNDTSLRMNVTLSRSHDGYPRYFNCAMTAAT